MALKQEIVGLRVDTKKTQSPTGQAKSVTPPSQAGPGFLVIRGPSCVFCMILSVDAAWMDAAPSVRSCYHGWPVFPSPSSALSLVMSIHEFLFCRLLKIEETYPVPI